MKKSIVLRTKQVIKAHLKLYIRQAHFCHILTRQSSFKSIHNLSSRSTNTEAALFNRYITTYVSKTVNMFHSLVLVQKKISEPSCITYSPNETTLRQKSRKFNAIDTFKKKQFVDD